ncbi:hypothetical protein ID866_10971 [Astraeus odoratus]|nr:hypothetical protein ID866_10971 [Astraeus odoratus]
MSMHKSSMIMGTLAVKITDWTKVPDDELVTDINNMDLVGNVKAWEKHRRLCVVHDAEIWRAEEAVKSGLLWTNSEAAAAEARKQQWVDSEAQVSKSWASMSTCIRCTRLGLTCIIPTRVKKHLACRSCTKAKEQCGECKKWVKKAANDDNDNNKIVILSGWKTKWQGGGKTLKEISDQRWGELIQAVSTCMDMANGHLERIASMAQSNGQKMQCHYMLMEGLVGQQQMLLSKLVEMASATGSGGAKEVAEGQEELQEP